MAFEKTEARNNYAGESQQRYNRLAAVLKSRMRRTKRKQRSWKATTLLSLTEVESVKILMMKAKGYAGNNVWLVEALYV
jgi:hypothetical protein